MLDCSYIWSMITTNRASKSRSVLRTNQVGTRSPHFPDHILFDDRLVSFCSSQRHDHTLAVWLILPASNEENIYVELFNIILRINYKRLFNYKNTSRIFFYYYREKIWVTSFHHIWPKDSAITLTRNWNTRFHYTAHKLQPTRKYSSKFTLEKSLDQSILSLSYNKAYPRDQTPSFLADRGWAQKTRTPPVDHRIQDNHKMMIGCSPHDYVWWSLFRLMSRMRKKGVLVCMWGCWCSQMWS